MSREAWDLSGKTALVTGAAKRLGRSIASALADRGAGVVVHYNTSADEARELAERLAKKAAAWTLQADLGDESQTRSLLDRAVELAGPIDVLVNNAAVYSTGGLLDLTAGDLARNVQANAFAPLQIARCFAAQGRPGAIVNLLDARVLDYNRSHVAYHLSKQMLLSLTQMMATEFAPAVRVNAVAPGLILPPQGADPDSFEKLAHTNLLGRVGDVEDVTDAVMFLLESGFITGQVIFVDGGRHLKGYMPR